jgi:hypothetical protein
VEFYDAVKRHRAARVAAKREERLAAKRDAPAATLPVVGASGASASEAVTKL